MGLASVFEPASTTSAGAHPTSKSKPLVLLDGTRSSQVDGASFPVIGSHTQDARNHSLDVWSRDLISAPKAVGKVCWFFATGIAGKYYRLALPSPAIIPQEEGKPSTATFAVCPVSARNWRMPTFGIRVDPMGMESDQRSARVKSPNITWR